MHVCYPKWNYVTDIYFVRPFRLKKWLKNETDNINQIGVFIFCPSHSFVSASGNPIVGCYLVMCARKNRKHQTHVIYIDIYHIISVLLYKAVDL